MHTFTVEVLTPASEGGLTWKSGSYRRNHFRGGHSETGGPHPHGSGLIKRGGI